MEKNSQNDRKFFTGRIAFFLAILLILLPLLGIVGSAQDAEDYAPILYFEAEESCYPVEAEYHTSNSDLTTIEIDGSTVEFYDNIHGTVNDNGVINHYKSQTTYDVKVYHRTYSSGGTTVIQYWMFYAFNKGELNRHEGDWELVQVVFKNGKPSEVGYSQHHSGQSATWGQVDRDGNHIKVYVARGSHANYLRSYSGKLGIASDIVGDNGKVIRIGSDELEELDDESWLSFTGLWGEVSGKEDFALGQAGPQGPVFRENGNMWNDPVAWQGSLSPASDMMFTLEWFIYNFVTIFILITVAIVALMLFFIYRRHKKYGLGPRIVSMLYINGINPHSIGNILCIAAIVIAIIGLVNPWYFISYEVTGEGAGELQTEGMVDLLTLDGMNGLQATQPGTDGPMPVGTFVIPFSLFIAIGLILMIIATIGIPLSRKLGRKYIFRGIRLMIPFILIVVMIMALGGIVPSGSGGSVETTYVNDILKPITESPFGGETSTFLPTEAGAVQIGVSWGLGIGGWLLLSAGIIMIVAGILEIIAKSTFYQTKTPLPGKKSKPSPKPIAPSPVQQTPPPSEKTKGKSKGSFCTECGAKLEENSKFCVKCGKKF